MSLTGAQLPALSLLGCRIDGGDVPAMAGRGVRIAGALTLRGSQIHTAAVAGAVALIGARIGGDLDCRGVVVGNSAGAAMEADRAQVDHNVLFVDGVLAEGVGERGTVRLTGERDRWPSRVTRRDVAQPDRADVVGGGPAHRARGVPLGPVPR